MTQNDILALIDAKIAGQGSAVDIGGALPAILSAITRAATPIEVEDITAMTKAQLDALNVGDKVVKVTGVQKHLYTVTYKGDGAGQGICLTYFDALNTETVAYDRSGDDWVYNSTDKGAIPSA